MNETRFVQVTRLESRICVPAAPPLLPCLRPPCFNPPFVLTPTETFWRLLRIQGQRPIKPGSRWPIFLRRLIRSHCPKPTIGFVNRPTFLDIALKPIVFFTFLFPSSSLLLHLRPVCLVGHLQGKFHKILP